MIKNRSPLLHLQAKKRFTLHFSLFTPLPLRSSSQTIQRFNNSTTMKRFASLIFILVIILHSGASAQSKDCFICINGTYLKQATGYICHQNDTVRFTYSLADIEFHAPHPRITTSPLIVHCSLLIVHCTFSPRCSFKVANCDLEIS